MKGTKLMILATDGHIYIRSRSLLMRLLYSSKIDCKAKRGAELDVEDRWQMRALGEKSDLALCSRTHASDTAGGDVVVKFFSIPQKGGSLVAVQIPMRRRIKEGECFELKNIGIGIIRAINLHNTIHLLSSSSQPLAALIKRGRRTKFSPMILEPSMNSHGNQQSLLLSSEGIPGENVEKED